LGLIKKLQQREVQEHEGRQMELMRMATDKEYDRLGSLHEYEDGAWDRPILSPETVEMDDTPLLPAEKPADPTESDE
jgi:hypothetical protein